MQARVYFQLKRRRRRRRRRRESSLQGGEQRSRWLRGESTFLWKQLPVSSHSLLSKKNPKCCSPTTTNRKNVGLLSFLQNTQRLHSVVSSHLSPGSHTNQRLGDDAVPIYTRAGQATPPGAADPIAERQGRYFEAVSQSSPLSHTQKDVLVHILRSRYFCVSVCGTGAQDGDVGGRWSVTSAPYTHMLRPDNCFYAWWRLRTML